MADTQTGTTTGTKARKKSRRTTRSKARNAPLAALNGNARAMLEDKAGQAYRQGRRVAKRVYAAAGNAMHDVRMPARRDLESFAEQNPLVLGAVGLGLGVVIGTLLPRYTSVMSSAPAMLQPRHGGGNRRPAKKAARKR